MPNDRDLTPEQLADKYNPEGDGEHPEWTRKWWREAVANDETLQGYWKWVYNQIEDNHEESDNEQG